MILFFSATLIFANPPVLNKAYDYPYALSSSSTEHFEFIYPDHLYDEAMFLASRAEGVVVDLIDFFGAKWPIKRTLKVVLTSDKAELNAYYSPFTFSHIVLHVTPPSEGELASFKRTLLSVFEHEVAHAYTLKIHAPAMRGASVFFGDYFCNSIFLPNFIVEGLAVAFESRNTDGRLNNPFAYMIAIQALSENKIPQWRELIGCIDTYPYPKSEYIIGGAFIDFLIKKYGREKFYSFIEGFGNMFSFPYLFNRIYGLSIEDAYRTFIASIPIMDDIVIPPSVINDQSRYKNLKYENGNFYYADLIANRIYRYSDKGIKEINVIDGIFDSFSVSDNGAYYSISVRIKDKCITKVYDIVHNKMLFVLDNAYSAGWFTYEGQNILVYASRNGMYSSIKAVNIDNKEVFLFDLDTNTEVISLSSFSNGKFSGIIKNEQGEFIAIFDVITSTYKLFGHNSLLFEGLSAKKVQTADDEYVVLTLSSAENKNIFELKNYPNILEATFTINGDFISANRYTTNIDGGVFYPVIVSDTAFFISHMFTNDRISSVQLSSVDKKDIKLYENNLVLSRSVKESNTLPSPIEEYKVGEILKNKTYSRFVNSIPFVNKGALMPLFYDHKTSVFSMPLALSYYSSDPTETIMSTLSFAYDSKPFIRNYNNRYFETNKLIFELSWNVNVLPVHFTIGLRPYLFLDKKTGLSVFGDFYLLSEYKHTFDHTTNYLKTALLFGWNGRLQGIIDTGINGFYVSLNASYTDLGKAGYGKREYEGYRAGVSYNFKQTTYNRPIYMDASVYGSLFLPHIIPVKNPPLITYNIPCKVSLYLDYAYNGVIVDANNIEEQFIHAPGAMLDVSFVLISFVIDKLISNYFPFVVNSFTITCTPSVKYRWVNGEAMSAHLMDIGLSAEAYFTLSAAFLGTAIGESDAEVGMRYDMVWRSDSRNTSFMPYPLFPWGRLSLIFRINADL